VTDDQKVEPTSELQDVTPEPESATEPVQDAVPDPDHTQAPAAPEPTPAPVETESQLIKYMGSSDVRVIEKGDTFDGQLPDGVESTLTWDWGNYHIVDVKAAGWSDEAVELLLDDEFEDVTGKKKVPPNMAQILWRGAKPHKKIAPDEKLASVDTGLVTDAEAAHQPGWIGRSSGAASTGGAAVPSPATSTG
jgi:hypothetical protein